MTAYHLSPEDHAASLHSYSRIHALLEARRQRLAEAGTLASEEGLKLKQDEAHLEAVREQIEHLASGKATVADERRYTETVMVKAAEWGRQAQQLEEKRAFLEGVVALHELGADGELVTVN